MKAAEEKADKYVEETILAVSKSFTAEEVVNELEDCDTLDDAIMFFKEYENKQCPIPVVRRNIFLWMEGFAATGQRQGASMIGTYEATDLDDAVKQYMETHKGYVDWDRFGRGRHAIWGCEIFDNEEEARKSFG